MFKHQNVWFINFCGIGNGVVIAPILRCFEKSYPSVNYYHTENQLLADSWFVKQAGLKNLKGFSPAGWRRFREEDWKSIELFIREKGINLITNFRNEGPRYDTGYYQFKEKLKRGNKSIIFWDLDFETIERRTKHQNLTGDILELFKTKGVNIATYNPKWLNPICRAKSRKRIGFGMAAGQSNKRWPITKWVELARILTGLDEKIVLIPGQSEKEINEAKKIAQNIKQHKCDIIIDESLHGIALRISGLKCFVSNDTGFLHLAAAIGIPTIGLYVSTNAEIWSPYDKVNFFAMQNNYISKCPDPKPHCGNCFHYYDLCPAIAKYGDDIEPNKVYEVIKSVDLLDRLNYFTIQNLTKEEKHD